MSGKPVAGCNSCLLYTSPTSHINGIAAITLTTLQYTPQKYQAVAKHTTQDHTTTPVLDHVNAAATANFISTAVSYTHLISSLYHFG